MPQPATPNRRERRKAKFGIPKEQKVSILEQQVENFKATLFQHEANIDRLVDRLEALPPAPAEGEDTNQGEREALEKMVQQEEKSMDIIEASIDTTQKKIAALN